MTSFIALSQFR